MSLVCEGKECFVCCCNLHAWGHAPLAIPHPLALSCIPCAAFMPPHSHHIHQSRAMPCGKRVQAQQLPQARSAGLSRAHHPGTAQGRPVQPQARPQHQAGLVFRNSLKRCRPRELHDFWLMSLG